MVNDAKLSAVLSEFARTLITDVPIQGILEHLVTRIVEVLPVTSAGVTLISAGTAPRYMAASDEAALRYEQLQTQVGQGPCVSAFETGEAVAVADLANDTRFPMFAPAAVAAGLAAMFTFPLRHGDGRLGALDLYRDSPGALDDDDMAAAQTLADVAAAYLRNAQARDDARATSDRFHHDATDRRLEIDLRAALAFDQLDVVYQPIVETDDQQIVGVEALVRWDHPTRGTIAPDTIIEIAEQSDLIKDIGRWVLQRACHDHGQWMKQHPDLLLDLAVNISARQIASADLPAAVATTLTATGMNPAELVLEMTETVLIDNAGPSMTTLTRLADLGVRLALDDFGSGYSSLSYLDRLPVHVVKIDQQFVARLTHDGADTTVIAGITTIAHGLGLTVIAEGIETRTQHDLVRALGCDYAQGFFYGRPMNAAALEQHFDDRPNRRRHVPPPITGPVPAPSMPAR